MGKAEEFFELKKSVDAAQTTANKAKGALGQILQQIKSEFGCKTIKEAKAKLAELEKEKIKAEKAFDKAKQAFEEKWEEGENES